MLPAAAENIGPLSARAPLQLPSLSPKLLALGVLLDSLTDAAPHHPH